MAKPFSIPPAKDPNHPPAEPEVEVLGGGKPPEPTPDEAPTDSAPTIADMAAEDAEAEPNPEHERAREWGAVRGRGRTLGMHNQLYANTLLFEELKAARAEIRALRDHLAEVLAALSPKK